MEPSCPFTFRSPSLGDLWSHWRGLLKPGRLPRRDEIDPGALRRVLPQVWIYRLDATGRDFYCALAGEEILAAWQPRTGMIGRPIRELFPPDVHETLRERWLGLLDRPAVMHGSSLYNPTLRDSTITRYAERLSLPVDGAEGRRYGLIGVTSYLIEPFAKVDVHPASLLPPKIVPVDEL